MKAALQRLLEGPAAREWLLDREVTPEIRDDPETFRFCFKNVTASPETHEALGPSFLSNYETTLTLKGYEDGMSFLWSSPETCPVGRIAHVHTRYMPDVSIKSSRSVGLFGNPQHALVVIFSWLSNDWLIVTFTKNEFMTRQSHSYCYSWQPGDTLRPSKFESFVEVKCARILSDAEKRMLQAMAAGQAQPLAIEENARTAFWKRWVARVRMGWEGRWQNTYFVRSPRAPQGLELHFEDEVSLQYDAFGLVEMLDELAGSLFDDFVSDTQHQMPFNDSFFDRTPDQSTDSGGNRIYRRDSGSQQSADGHLHDRLRTETSAVPGKNVSPDSSGTTSEVLWRAQKNGMMSAQNTSSPTGSEEGPFVCIHCDKAYTQRSSMERHVKLVHEKQAPHECKLCGVRFSVKCNLTRHIQNIHHQNRPFRCLVPNCQWSFSQKFDLRRHLKRKHNLEGDQAEAAIEALKR
ncbi:Transcription factor hamlet [Porphyridium purpureum]|uniref:Transcription factor hamlet n=1 Tax=Porphyridium purpureum TaxID=35688 RepID=A0A5J4YNH1_PORPP|nr:Transcription factor hamlet [Porphyridium purpureum]|eukprot:POR5164..scf222_8